MTLGHCFRFDVEGDRGHPEGHRQARAPSQHCDLCCIISGPSVLLLSSKQRASVPSIFEVTGARCKLEMALAVWTSAAATGDELDKHAKEGLLIFSEA